MDAASAVGATAAANAQQPSSAAKPSRAGELREVCGQFESIFLTHLTRAMRRTVPKTGLLDGGLAGDIYRDMLDVEFAARMAERGGVGLGEMLYRQLNERLSGE